MTLKNFKKTRTVLNLILGRIGQIGQFAQNSAMEVPNFEQDNVQTEINVMVKTGICGTAIYILVRVRALWSLSIQQKHRYFIGG